jgi:hypothetical protein
MTRPEWIDFHPDPRAPRQPSRWRLWYWHRRRARCFHHEHGGNPANTRPAHSWIQQQLIDLGRRKMFWCDEAQGGCGKTWFA